MGVEADGLPQQAGNMLPDFTHEVHHFRLTGAGLILDMTRHEIVRLGVRRRGEILHPVTQGVTR